MIENMKDIPGYQGLYAVTPQGKVWSYYSQKFLKETSNENGYLKVTLFKERLPKKCIYIHKLVAITYIPKPFSDEELTVDHIDRNHLNNNVSNLRWVNRSIQNQNKDWTEKRQEAANKGGRAKSKAVEQRDKDNHDILINTFPSSLQAAIQLFNDKNKNSLINRCANGNRPSAYGYWWKFVE